MTTIYKYDVPELGPFEIELPLTARVLTVQLQGAEGIKLWVLQDNEFPATKKRKFVGCFTGKDCEQVATAKYIGTVQLEDGRIVTHYFELY